MRWHRFDAWAFVAGTQSSSTKTTWLAAVNVIAVEQAVIWPMNTRHVGSFWNRSISSWRSWLPSPPTMYAGLNSASCSRSISSAALWYANTTTLS